MKLDRTAGSFLCVAFLVVACAACAPERHQEASAPPADESAGSSQPAEAEAATAGELAGTSWQLVKIMSMDDTVSTPDDPTLYTLEFADDGSMSLQADCNRGTGSWSSDSPGQLQFGVIAATQAMCPPGSLHDTYLAQFEWVRSYTMAGGHLFLATMADGSIIEFEPK